MTTIDLNLLAVFDQIMKTKSVTRAAGELGLSQPAVSLALQRLRQQFGDPLFVRIRNVMEPTARATQLHAAVAQGLDLIRKGIDGSQTFEPASSRAHFRLLMSDIGQVIYLPTLMRFLRNEAPGITVECVQLSKNHYRQALESGEADMAYGQFPQLGPAFYQQKLFTDKYVCLARDTHPRVRGKLTLRQFLNESHIKIGSTGNLIEIELERMKIHRPVALTISHFLGAPLIVKDSDLLALIPSWVMRVTPSVAGVKELALPLKVPQLVIRQCWHERSHHDAAHRWLRANIAELIRAEATAHGLDIPDKP